MATTKKAAAPAKKCCAKKCCGKKAAEPKVEKLAIDGGKKVWAKPFPAWPQFNPKTNKKVLDILASGKVNYWTGPVGMEFEKAWAKWLGVKNAISVSNGTAALHVALTALGIGSGDEVICTSYSFIASSFCALQAGALPVFVDVGTDHLIDPAKIEAAITKRTKAIVVVHLYGMVADMDPIMKIAKKYKLAVVEDCAQCFGGKYKGKKAGTISTVGCFSFCQSKHFTTGGEGGMVCCNDDDLAWECRSVRDHGYDVKAKLNLLQMEGKQLYIHRRVGYNFRMTEIQSAIGLGELERFDKWNLAQRKKLGKALMKGLKGHPLIKYMPVDTKERENSFWLVPFVVDTSKLKCTMKEFIAAVQAEGACAYSVLWPEMYKEEAFAKRKGFGTASYPFNDPAHRKIDYTKFNCEMANSLADSTISFWTHPTYTLEHIEADVKAFKKVAAAMMK
ncbi:MAG: DegT/DnrJ/EryC1/StrS family aminotransferase [Kiritimatiellae bacterium]|nr:DegT/DnrJ/EryC1/StrS family aminotransferase [Kiritimatiellia bacterium]